MRAIFRKCLFAGYVTNHSRQVCHICRIGAGLQDLGQVGRWVMVTYFSSYQSNFSKMLVCRISGQPVNTGVPYLQGRCRTTRSRSSWKMGHGDLLFQFIEQFFQNACVQDIWTTTQDRCAIFVGNFSKRCRTTRSRSSWKMGHGDLLFQFIEQFFENACVQDMSPTTQDRCAIFVGQVQDYKIQVKLEDGSW